LGAERVLVLRRGELQGKLRDGGDLFGRLFVFAQEASVERVESVASLLGPPARRERARHLRRVGRVAEHGAGRQARAVSLDDAYAVRARARRARLVED